MESATFRKWLAEKGCRFDHQEHQVRGEGPVIGRCTEKGGHRRHLLGVRARTSIRATCAGSARNSASIGLICLDPRAGREAPDTIDRPSHRRGPVGRAGLPHLI